MSATTLEYEDILPNNSTRYCSQHFRGVDSLHLFIHSFILSFIHQTLNVCLWGQAPGANRCRPSSSGAESLCLDPSFLSTSTSSFSNSSHKSQYPTPCILPPSASPLCILIARVPPKERYPDWPHISWGLAKRLRSSRRIHLESGHAFYLVSRCVTSNLCLFSSCPPLTAEREILNT